MKKLVALIALLFALAACGGGGGGRPSTDDIAKALKDKDNPAGAAFNTSGADDKVIDCLAKAFHDSDLSDGALKAIVKGDADYKGSKKDSDVAGSKDFQDSVTKCIAG